MSSITSTVFLLVICGLSLVSAVGLSTGEREVGDRIALNTTINSNATFEESDEPRINFTWTADTNYRWSLFQMEVSGGWIAFQYQYPSNPSLPSFRTSINVQVTGDPEEDIELKLIIHKVLISQKASTLKRVNSQEAELIETKTIFNPKAFLKIKPY